MRYLDIILRHIFPLPSSEALHKRGSRENNNGTVQRAPNFSFGSFDFRVCKEFLNHKENLPGY